LAKSISIGTDAGEAGIGITGPRSTVGIGSVTGTGLMGLMWNGSDLKLPVSVLLLDEKLWDV